MANQRFEEIDVERINIVEPDGTLRLTIANNARSPDPLLEGTPDSRAGTRGAGLIFFNDEGFEVGGLGWSGTIGSGDSSLTFDRFGQDQVISIGYHENDGAYGYSIEFCDRPTESILTTVENAKRITEMEPGDEKVRAIKEEQEKHPSRIVIGRGVTGEATVGLLDTKGRPRIMMTVGADDEPRLLFLDADGNVTFSLPPER
jgi:hypothetical protein